MLFLAAFLLLQLSQLNYQLIKDIGLSVFGLTISLLQGKLRNKPAIALWLRKQSMLGCFMLQPSLLELYYCLQSYKMPIWLIYKLKKHDDQDWQTDRQTDGQTLAFLELLSPLKRYEKSDTILPEIWFLPFQLTQQQ